MCGINTASCAHRAWVCVCVVDSAYIYLYLLLYCISLEVLPSLTLEVDLMTPNVAATQGNTHFDS